jgi:outer membrane protein OmpA-like peptidoglycan-associated protein
MRFWATLTLLLATLGAQAQEVAEREEKVTIFRRRIHLAEKIYFEHARGRILPRSFPILDLLARKLKENPQIELVQIEGHTSAVGPKEVNLRLSRWRARSVRNYLIERGVQPERLVAKGFGEEWPIASNLTERGEEKNRRVEFVIVQQLRQQVWRRSPPTADYVVVVRAAVGTQEGHNESDPRVISEGQALYARDSLVTPPTGGAVLRLPGLVLVHVQPASLIRLETVRGGENREVALRLVRGALSIRSFTGAPQPPTSLRVLVDPVEVTCRAADVRLVRERKGARVEVLQGEAQVRAGDGSVAVRAGKGLRALEGSLQMTVQPLPARPRHRHPERGTVPRSDLTWAPVRGASAYRVEVARDVDFLDIVWEQTVSSTAATTDLPPGSYYWRVRARDQAGFEGEAWPRLRFDVQRP